MSVYHGLVLISTSNVRKTPTDLTAQGRLVGQGSPKAYTVPNFCSAFFQGGFHFLLLRGKIQPGSQVQGVGKLLLIITAGPPTRYYLYH